MVAVLRYYFGAIRWSKAELVQLDRMTRRVMRQNKAHYYSAALERLYLPRKEGGRGLQELYSAWECEVVGAVIYLLGSDDPQVCAAMQFQIRREVEHRSSWVAVARGIVRKYGLEGVLPPRGEDVNLPHECPKIGKQ